MDEINIEYNSEKDELVIREYGRNVQKMIRHAKTIENDQERQAYVEKVIDLMQRMYPQSRNQEDSRIKLWQHIFRIANYELDVKPTLGPMPSPNDIVKKPEQISYPLGDVKYKHYGYNVQKMIKKAVEMEDEEMKKGYTKVIASYMKLAHNIWNKENFSTDDNIRNDLKTISEGQLELDENVVIEATSKVSSNSYHHSGGYNNNRRNKKRTNNSGRNHRSNNNRSGGNKGRKRK